MSTIVLAHAPPCCHCHGPSGNRYFGLCYRCYADREIRARYKTPRRKCNMRHDDDGIDFCGGYQLPAEPTTAVPGTEEKVAVFLARIAAGVSLFHPDDAPVDLTLRRTRCQFWAEAKRQKNGRFATLPTAPKNEGKKEI